MPIIKAPLLVNCYNCKKSFFIKFVAAHKSYSKKNDWDYWTEKKEDKDKKYCNSCLLFLYKKEKWRFREFVTSEKKRKCFRQYCSLGIFFKIFVEV